MKLFCLECFLKGRIHVIKDKACPACGGSRGLMTANCQECSKECPAMWPEGSPEPVCREHKNPEMFQ